MLYALSIQSFVLIDRLDLEAANGFTALTGETGAGKSIILDALNLVTGGAADRKQVRAGADAASITAEFTVPDDHVVWDILRRHEIAFDPSEGLLLRRMISRTGPSRAFVNSQSVAAAVLSEIGEVLIEIHGQHAASSLMKPSAHMELLDAFGDLKPQVKACQSAWVEFETARQNRIQLFDEVKAAQERQEWLAFAVEELSKIAAEPGEIEMLAAQRSVLLQSERITEAIAESSDALRDPRLEDSLLKAAKAVDRVVRVPGLDSLEGDLSQTAFGASEALERTLIELAEAKAGVDALGQYAEHDATELSRLEERLFSLRAVARKYDCPPEQLPERFNALREELALCDSNADALQKAIDAEAVAEQSWQGIAQSLSEHRRASASTLEVEIEHQLKPLHLERVKVRVAFQPIDETESGARGLERATFEVETNPGAGFGQLKAIASGGELARFSLALKNALSESSHACTLIFDEADQGVGGAVAAAIGERLNVLSQDRQVFAVTHSPQVASSATRQWRVLKEADSDDQIFTHVAQLDEGQRLEEIARMLSGSSITNEARAAALKLLEAA